MAARNALARQPLHLASAPRRVDAAPSIRLPFISKQARTVYRWSIFSLITNTYQLIELMKQQPCLIHIALGPRSPAAAWTGGGPPAARRPRRTTLALHARRIERQLTLWRFRSAQRTAVHGNTPVFTVRSAVDRSAGARAAEPAAPAHGRASDFEQHVNMSSPH